MEYQDIKVSIICNTYNHEKYIKDALDGFLMQKTNFSYEVLIHDDASTDGTAEIIREYENKFPDIIKPIYQKINQYSQNIDITFAYQLPRAKGVYIALCEGDDYWTDSLKLQKQFDLMEKHPEIDICTHCATMIKASHGKKIGTLSPADKFMIFNAGSVIKGGGGFVATNSIFYRKQLNNKVPDFRLFYSFDYTLQIHGSIRGGMLYLPDNMSVYRAFVPGSWSQRMNNTELIEKHLKKLQQMFMLLDEETHYEYTDIIKDKISEARFYALEKIERYDDLKSRELEEWYERQSIKFKIRFYIKRYCPFLVQIYRIIKWKI